MSAQPNVEGGFSMSVPNILGMIATMMPVMLAFFMIMISVFNQNVKGLVYLGGVLIAVAINTLLLKISPADDVHSNARSALCKVMDFPYTQGRTTPYMNSMFIAFTATYLFFPMYEAGAINISVVISMIALFCIDAGVNFSNGCVKKSGIASGLLVGVLLGWAWFAILNTSNKGLLFFNEVNSDGYFCSKPSEQTFKCKMYKNGELIGTV
jgi:hypothetical protein